MQEYTFSIFGVLKEALNRSNGVKGTFMGAMLLYLLIQIVIAFVLLLIMPQIQDYLDLILTLLTLPISVGIIILGITRARGEELSVKQIFDYFGQYPYLLLGYFLIVLFTVLGLIAFIIPGIYLSIAYIYALPLIADKNLSVWNAMELSRKTITKQWFRFFGLGIVSFFFILLSAIPFGIGLIWSIPTVYIAYGLLYHQLFDEEEEDII
ncbi:hypothetical protein [Sulfurimonas paralvinellae]|uniref:DUF975 family protein n=1 Tax=Sulfurimonas paralvinellae TaxID=317658 RepID=A0A7M1B8Q4_9BACT|nr:hypothetical protein [Sulfurimonas paralvinellae]QOP46100.1 hypothetical protein FM071_07280 [Sulfurimonas paralvinellae]